MASLPERVLVGTDFSAAARRALEMAGELGRRFGSSLTLFHAHDPAPLGRATPFIPFQMSRQDIERQATERAQDALRQEREEAVADLEGVRIDARIHRSASAAICEEAETLAVDLVVVGHRGHAGIQRLFIGGVAEKVVRHAPCSVLAVADEQPRRPPMKILVAVDMSDTSLQAAETAAAWARGFDAAMTLLHVVPPVSMSAAVPAAASPLPLGTPLVAESVASARATIEASRESLLRVRALQCSDVARVDVDVVQHPSVASLIGERVKQQDFDLVVLGSVGHGPIERVMLGSVAEKVVRHTTRSVLVVRPALPEA